ncbi:MAG: prepilin-type N-terminal cleavage/methylation domain-containing protein [Gemmatimonadota bacterium]|jgi:prepilin-type N-terminal cleavage/methylation domain-containing protein
MKRPGFTLLEAMVAMVILSLTVVTALGFLADTVRSSARADEWARAVTLAEDGMDRALAGTIPRAAVWTDTADQGFLRRIQWTSGNRPGLTRIDVIITWPGNGRFVLSRLARTP